MINPVYYTPVNVFTIPQIISEDLPTKNHSVIHSKNLLITFQENSVLNVTKSKKGTYKPSYYSAVVNNCQLHPTNIIPDGGNRGLCAFSLVL